jgi:hypothetical protein
MMPPKAICSFAVLLTVLLDSVCVSAQGLLALYELF